MRVFGKLKLLLAAASLASAAVASAAVIVTVGAAGTATTSLTGYNFSLANLNSSDNGLAEVSFAGSGITANRTSGFVSMTGANVYGGAGGAGLYGSVNGDPATYQLSQSVNYFGLWGSALDGNNTVALYNDNTLLGTYALQSVLQNSPGFSNSYYGNPFGGGNSGEAYAFFNFASDTAFNRVQLIQNGGGGFEFDNLTVGTTVVSTAPEPTTWAMLLLGFGAIGWVIRRQPRVRAIPATA